LVKAVEGSYAKQGGTKKVRQSKEVVIIHGGVKHWWRGKKKKAAGDDKEAVQSRGGEYRGTWR